jgi:hypothetical protein
MSNAREAGKRFEGLSHCLYLIPAGMTSQCGNDYEQIIMPLPPSTVPMHPFKPGSIADVRAFAIFCPLVATEDCTICYRLYRH